MHKINDALQNKSVIAPGFFFLLSKTSNYITVEALVLLFELIYILYPSLLFMSAAFHRFFYKSGHGQLGVSKPALVPMQNRKKNQAPLLLIDAADFCISKFPLCPL